MYKKKYKVKSLKYGLSNTVKGQQTMDNWDVGKCYEDDITITNGGFGIILNDLNSSGKLTDLCLLEI